MATMSANASWKATMSGLLAVEHPAVHAVEDGVRHLVRDDVVRQAGEHEAAGKLVPRIGGRRVEVAEQQRRFRRRIVGVLLAQSVRIDPEPLDVPRSRLRRCSCPSSS